MVLVRFVCRYGSPNAPERNSQCVPEHVAQLSTGSQAKPWPSSLCNATQYTTHNEDAHFVWCIPAASAHAPQFGSSWVAFNLTPCLALTVAASFFRSTLSFNWVGILTYILCFKYAHMRSSSSQEDARVLLYNVVPRFVQYNTTCNNNPTALLSVFELQIQLQRSSVKCCIFRFKLIESNCQLKGANSVIWLKRTHVPFTLDVSAHWERNLFQSFYLKIGTLFVREKICSIILIQHNTRFLHELHSTLTCIATRNPVARDRHKK